MKSFWWSFLESLPDALCATGGAMFLSVGVLILLIMKQSAIMPVDSLPRLAVVCWVGGGEILVGYILSQILWRYRVNRNQVYLGNWRKSKK